MAKEKAANGTKPVVADDGFIEATTEFGDSADGWYQQAEEGEPPILVFGTYLGPDSMERKGEKRNFHKFRLKAPCEALAAKGHPEEGRSITLKAGEIIAVWGRWELDEKLKGKDGIDLSGVDCKIMPTEKEEISNDRTLWHYSVRYDQKAYELKVARAANAAKAGSTQQAQGNIPF